ncbi:hypothetical protein XENOCAPTIV_010658 [Xenoophorus captivus]|uniref:Cytosol aminopeptidase domain-containing protein n=1 Tax=Xenoophorus captivus TaxID=1517983 RepID=A0ABV0SG78_9TELE
MTWQAALNALNPNPTDSCPLYLNQAVVAALPSRVSRHNTPASVHFLSRLIRSCLPGGNNRCIVVNVFASACAVARAFPLFTRRSASSRRTEKKHVTVEFVAVGNDSSPLDDAEIREIKAVGSELGITPVIIRGEELKQRGFGGIYGVGKAAENPPALAVLSHTPDGATQTIAWVGKGIVYDTGGLSIKGKGISTGKYHAAVMTNSEQWEVACVRAGRSSGDLTHPLVYCPELHFSEFTSAVADMKNSVAVSDKLLRLKCFVTQSMKSSLGGKQPLLQARHILVV